MTKMTHAMRMELANAVRDRYATAAHKDKGRILEEFVAATGYHEKSAIRVLNSAPGSCPWAWCSNAGPRFGPR